MNKTYQLTEHGFILVMGTALDFQEPKITVIGLDDGSFKEFKMSEVENV
jgi:hypothetical protein|tara:strand:- start:16011 stop:16157 length:147 start_codon:yes stop_codon:yes gene_type:complete